MERNKRKNKKDSGLLTVLVIGAAAYLAWQYYKKQGLPRGTVEILPLSDGVFLPDKTPEEKLIEETEKNILYNEPFDYYQEYKGSLAGTGGTKIPHAI